MSHDLFALLFSSPSNWLERWQWTEKGKLNERIFRELREFPFFYCCEKNETENCYCVFPFLSLVWFMHIVHFPETRYYYFSYFFSRSLSFTRSLTSKFVKRLSALKGKKCLSIGTLFHNHSLLCIQWQKKNLLLRNKEGKCSTEVNMRCCNRDRCALCGRNIKFLTVVLLSVLSENKFPKLQKSFQETTCACV